MASTGGLRRIDSIIFRPGFMMARAEIREERFENGAGHEEVARKRGQTTLSPAGQAANQAARRIGGQSGLSPFSSNFGKATKNKPGLTYPLAILPLESFLESPGSRKRTADKSRNPGCPQRLQP